MVTEPLPATLYINLSGIRSNQINVQLHLHGFSKVSFRKITVNNLIMSEILQIFHQSPPSHRETHPRIQPNLLDVESQFGWSINSSGFPSPGIFDVTDQFPCSELPGSPLMNLSSSSVDELSMVTAIIEQNQSTKKRKLESAECDSELNVPPKAKRSIHNRNPKPKMDLEADFIHVRARRGQATDSHSLAERARREKIKKKMQFLQDLVPGCNKITNKAAILDEIINYVQCLQRDVEFLTLKLADSTTSVDLKMDNSFPEELWQWQWQWQ